MSTISQPRVQLINLNAHPDTSVVTSNPFFLHPASTGMTMTWFFDQIGTISIQWRPLGQTTFRQIATQAVVASTANKLDIPGNLGEIRLQFTPGVGPVTGYIDMTYYGHSAAGG